MVQNDQVKIVVKLDDTVAVGSVNIWLEHKEENTVIQARVNPKEPFQQLVNACHAILSQQKYRKESVPKSIATMEASLDDKVLDVNSDMFLGEVLGSAHEEAKSISLTVTFSSNGLCIAYFCYYFTQCANFCVAHESKKVVRAAGSKQTRKI